MSELNAATARIMRGRVVTTLTTSCSVLVNTLERLCDYELDEDERELATDQLYGAVADVRLALALLAELAGSGEHDGDAAGVVVRVTRSRFRQHRWSHRP